MKYMSSGNLSKRSIYGDVIVEFPCDGHLRANVPLYFELII